MGELESEVAESSLDHQLLAVVRPALRERVREVTLEDRVAKAVLVEQVDIVSGVTFVDRDVPEHRVIQVAKPFLPFFRRPRFLDGCDIVEALPRDLLEAPGRIQCRGGEAEESWGLHDLGPLLRRDRDEVVGDDELPNLLEHGTRVVDQALRGRMVRRDAFDDLQGLVSRVNPFRGLLELTAVRIQVRAADVEESLDRDVDKMFRENHPLVLASPEGEVGLQSRAVLRGEVVHEGLQFRGRRFIHAFHIRSNAWRNAAQDLRQLARVCVEHTGRGHLPDLEKRLREATVQRRTQVPEKAWDLGLQLSDCPDATVERSVLPQEIVDDVHAEQEVKRERPRQTLVFDFGQLGEEETAKDAESKPDLPGEAIAA